jgi:hypothetical protein
MLLRVFVDDLHDDLACRNGDECHGLVTNSTDHHRCALRPDFRGVLDENLLLAWAQSERERRRVRHPGVRAWEPCAGEPQS